MPIIQSSLIDLIMKIRRSAKMNAHGVNDAEARRVHRDFTDMAVKESLTADGIYQHQVTCDETNNTPSNVEEGDVEIDVRLRYSPSLRYIRIRTVVLKNTGIISYIYAGGISDMSGHPELVIEG